ncbi:MAG: hypothetical protein EXR01_04165 [Acetobacteraceae bacterium]|nr:hypothetical protein [Acetobacteraceae bacterium]
MSFRPAAFLPVLAALAGLAGCSAPKLTEFQPSCPRVVIVADAADLSRYRATGGQDLTDLVLDGRIVGFKGGCERENRDYVRTNLTVDLRLTRGPAGVRASQVSYFVAVREGDLILDKRTYTLGIQFPENQDQMRMTGPETSLLVAVSKEKSGAAYDVLIGFQLSAEELALNRRRGPR